MEIKAGKLREALELLEPVVPGRPTMPVLTYVLLKDGQAVATNLEQAVIVALPEAVETLLVPHRNVLELLNRIPANQAVLLEGRIEASDSKLALSWAGGQATYDSASEEDYPPLPKMEPAGEGTLDGDILVSALLSVVGYTAREDSRPILTGVAMELGDRVTVVAADGFRLAVRDLPLGFPQPAGVPQVVVIPGRTVRLLGQLWKKAPGTAQMDLVTDLAHLAVAKRPLELAVNAAYIQARFGRVTVLSQLNTGTFPNYRQLIPEKFAFRVRVMARDLEQGCRAIAGVAMDGSGIVRLVWSNSTLSLSAQATETGEMKLSIPVQTEGGEGKIALNVNYLLAYLRGKEGLVEMCVDTPSSPVVLHHPNSPLVVVMPMFVNWETSAPQAKPETATETPETAEPTEPAESSETDE